MMASKCWSCGKVRTCTHPCHKCREKAARARAAADFALKIWEAHQDIDEALADEGPTGPRSCKTEPSAYRAFKQWRDGR